MRNLKIALVGLLLLGNACSQSVDEMVSEKNDKLQWVDLEIMVKSTVDTVTYLYMGQIASTTLEEFRLNKPGLFKLSNIRYYKNDSIFKYEDNADEGTIYFNRRDVLKCVLLKQDPWIDSLKKKGD